MKEKEYIAKVSGDWRLVDSHELVSGRIEVPEGAEIFLLDKSFQALGCLQCRLVEIVF